VLLACVLVLVCAAAAFASPPQVAAGPFQTCVLVPSGHIECWGEGNYGQLGDGAFESSDVPVEVKGIAGATELAGGFGHVCAALSDGHVDCWGWNNSGQLGNGTTTSSDTPVEVQGITNATDVAAGETDSCATLSSGHVDCWGDDSDGQLGNGTTSGSDTPVEVTGITNATQIAAGFDHVCAVLATGHIECWGQGGYGQLGNGADEGSDTPVEVSGIANAAQVTGGQEHTCARLSTGHIDCWGANWAGQLGDGGPGGGDLQGTPSEVQSITNATSVSAGAAHTCAVLSTRRVDCWGWNPWGQLGNGTVTNAKIPVETLSIANATQVAAGEEHTCAMLSDGRVDCWGRDYWEQLGDGIDGRLSTTPVGVVGLTDVARIAVGGEHACAVLSSGHIDCWGANEDGQLGNATNSDADTPIGVQSIADGIQVAAGYRHSCAALSGGQVDCWGDNGYGQLGDGTTTGPEKCSLGDGEYAVCSTVPVQVQSIATVIQVAAGVDHSCAVLSSGHVDCWGANSQGQLGDGTTSNSDIPVEVVGVTNVATIAAGWEHTCAVLSSGHIDCWGANGDGQLGDGTRTSSDVPREVTGITNATDVAAGQFHTCATLSSGHIECWGSGEEGQLGDGSTGESDTPVEVQSITNAIEVAAGGEHTCAMLPSGHDYCWGRGFEGQLADGARSSSDVPVEVDSIANATQVAAGGEQTCAALATGEVACWGFNSKGQLGDGTAWSAVPTEVLGVFWVQAPSVVTDATSSVTQTGAVLNGTVSPEGGEVSSCQFEYGLTSSYGASAPCSPALGSGTSPVAVFATLSDLSANATYHYRIVATNAGGTSEGSERTFKTLPDVPPEARIESPASGGTYLQGAGVATRFSCTEGEDGPGLESCTDSNGASGSSGTLETSALGVGTYTVTAKSKDGQTGTASISYTVAKATCSSNTSTITLSPGLTNTAAVQTVKIKGTLTGCTGDAFTGVGYKATLTTAGPVSCSVLKGAGETASGAAQFKWTPKAKPASSTATLGMSLTETASVTLSGAVSTGPHSPLTLSEKTSETFTGGPTCGVAEGEKKAKALKKGRFIGTTAVFE
jgi:alpha-tubulin suppressor-like RCC1 family protein